MRVSCRLAFILLVVLWLGTTESAHAVPPPEFIFQAGSQIAQIFSVAMVFMGMFFAFLSHSWKKVGIVAILIGGVLWFF